MATRMQQRRGTAEQWTSTNGGLGPILNMGEIGWESDTNKFKIGDGQNHWTALSYFLDEDSLGGSLGDYLTVDDLGQPLKAASLDQDGKLEVAQLPDSVPTSSDITTAVNNAVSSLVDGAPGVLDTLNELAAALGDDANFVTTIASDIATKQDKVTGVSDTEIGYLANVTSDIQTQIDGKLASADLDEAAQEAVNTALVAGTGLDKTYDDLNNTITLNIDSTVATTTYVDDAIAAFDALPTQTGNDGKFLQTTGSGTQWAEVDLTTKQDSLTAGSNIDISNDIISVTGLLSTDISDFNTAANSATLSSYDAAGSALTAENNAKGYADSLATNYDPAGSASTAQTNAQNYADGLAVNYDAYGAASTAETNANNYTDTSISGLSGNVTAVVAGNLDVLTGTGITTGAGSIEVDFTELSTRYDALGAADTAEQDANLYTDNAITALNLATTYDAKGAAATVQGNLDNHELDTSTHGVTSSIVGTDDSQTLTNKTISSANNTVTVQVANVSDLTATATELNTLDGITASTAELNYVDGVTSSVQDQLDAKMPLAGGTFSGTVYGTNLELSGNLTVDGTFSSVPTETLTVTNPMIYMGDGNTANINDLGMVGSHTINSVYSHTGLVKDATDGKWKLFTGVTDEPTTTINFSQATLDTLVAATFEGNVTGDVTGNADTATALETARNIAGQSFDGTADINIAPTDLTGVTATAAQINLLDGATLSTTELNYVDGVTSSIQTQIDTKLATSTAASTYAPIANPTFTGTVAGVTKSMVGLGNVDNTADADKPVSTAVGAELDLKADLNAPTFTGSVVLPETTAIGNVSSTEIGYLDGVTSAIQTQLNAKLSTSTAASTYAPIDSPVFTGPISALKVTAGEQGFALNNGQETKFTVDASGHLVAGASITAASGFILNNGQQTVFNVNSSGVVTATSFIGDGSQLTGISSLPDQSQNSGKYLTTDGQSASWATLSVPITTGTATISQNTALVIDMPSTEGSHEYTIRLKQGTKIRSSKVLVNFVIDPNQSPAAISDHAEFAITETNGSIAGVNISTTATMMGVALQVTVTDAASTNVDVKFSRVSL